MEFLFCYFSFRYIIAREIEFGDVKSQQWFISVLWSFFSSILLTEPIKILSLGIIFAFFCQKPPNEDEEAKEYFDENQFVLNKDEEHLHSPIHTFLPTRTNRLTPNENASFQVQHLQKSFRVKVSSINEYGEWLEEDFVGKIRAHKWYNEKNVEYLRGYLNDTSNRLLGWTLMKQSRIRTQLCPKRIKLSSICRNNFSRGYVYEFRGSLQDLRTNLSELHRLGWTDQQTREIQIQMSFYNPNADLFTFVTTRTEFYSTGNIHCQSRFEPIHFYGNFFS
ncbi:unnamed protein product [Adineta ricciae]|uniref:Polycystin domain-containing protein n=1 Tax=Adineta ricciae TaxID=249248 RepID=A0A815Q0F2_ADIRI|nr:unnamed protein product [Adineta ricciae]